MLAEYTQFFTTELKTRKYKKSRLTWYKQCDDEVTVVFSVQKSQYGADVWYYYFGIALNKLHTSVPKSISACDMIYRVNMTMDRVMLKSEQVMGIVDLWESKYGNIKALRMAAIEGKLKGFQVSPKALTYLTKVDITKL